MTDEPNFKVTDRRLFNPDGTPRELSPEEQPETPSPVAATTASSDEERAASVQPEGSASAARDTATAAALASEFDDEAQLNVDDPASFANFVMSIASNAASSLGMMEHPVTHKREVDLELAKHWIDVLGMLQSKTRNNLVAQEAKILESLLADLRMQYVSLTSASAGKSAGTFTGHDILGG